jgi:hypothetical protein
MSRRLIAVVVLLSLVLAGLASAQTKPTLRLVRDTPLTLRGSGFRSGEIVRLTLLRAGKGRVDRSIRAGAAGTFTARFPLLVATQPCRSLTVRAVGAEGRQALYTHRCQPPDPALP